MPRKRIAGEFSTLADLRRAIVSRRGEGCQAAGHGVDLACSGPVQCAHIMSAGQGGHLVMDNAIMLCLNHHTAYDGYTWRLPISLLWPEARVYLANQGYLWLNKDGTMGGRGSRRFEDDRLLA